MGSLKAVKSGLSTVYRQSRPVYKQRDVYTAYRVVSYRLRYSTGSLVQSCAIYGQSNGSLEQSIYSLQAV